MRFMYAMTASLTSWTSYTANKWIRGWQVRLEVHAARGARYESKRKRRLPFAAVAAAPFFRVLEANRVSP
jgi:hypothetical protein